MNNLRGIELRYVLTMHLFSHGRSTIEDLVLDGFAVDSPAGKSVSDALRDEANRSEAGRSGISSDRG